MISKCVFRHPWERDPDEVRLEEIKKLMAEPSLEENMNADETTLRLVPFPRDKHGATKVDGLALIEFENALAGLRSRIAGGRQQVTDADRRRLDELEKLRRAGSTPNDLNKVLEEWERQDRRRSLEERVVALEAKQF